MALEPQFDVVVAEGSIEAMKRLSNQPKAHDCLVIPASPNDIPLRTFLSEVSRAAPGVATVAFGELPTGPGDAAALIETDAYVPPGREADLASRIQELISERRVRRAIVDHEALERTVGEIAVDLVAAADRHAIESAVYDHLIGGADYEHVWIAREVDGGELEVSTPMDGRLDREELDDLVRGGDADFVSKAIETGQVMGTNGQVSTRSASGTVPPVAGADADRTRSLESVAIPFVQGGKVWGVAVVSTERSDAFDAAEREVLADLGAIVGHALWAHDSSTSETRSEYRRGMENLVHDLRNPLGIARSHLELAREDGDVESLDRAISALDRMVSTIDRVAEGVAGMPNVETAPTDLESAAMAAWETVQDQSATMTVLEPTSIRADRDLLVRMLANLFQNAVHHGGQDVSVQVGTVSGGFFVEDDGPGIPESERTMVFERGFSTSDDGLGIGLSIVDDVADVHGWTMSVTGAETGGARFEVTNVERVEEPENV